MSILYGTAAADVLRGSRSDDFYIGGLGADTFVFSFDAGHDVVVWEDTDSAGDVLWLEGVSLEQVQASYVDTTLQFSLGDGSSLRLLSWTSSLERVHKFLLNEGLFCLGGDASSDWLQADEQPGFLYGFGADDTLVGGNTRDVLDGGAGADMLWGGSAGEDTLIGGAGVDTFFWGSNRGTTRISDAENAETVFLYDLRPEDLSVVHTGSDLQLSSTEGAVLVLNNAYDLAVGGGLKFRFADGSLRTLSNSGSWNSISPSNFSICFDYRFDTSGFFRDQPERQAILEQAAQEWGQHIQDEFEDVPAGTMLNVSNPVTGADELFASSSVIDDLLVFVGAADIDNPAHGGPSAYYTVGSSLDQRWNSTSNFEPWVGSITFDTRPAYSDGSSLNWFFDPTPADASDVASAGAGKEDLLSVAIHEIGHVLGIVGGGGVPAFSRWCSDSYFVGSSAVAANGGRSVLLIDGTHPDGYHGGFGQEVAMAYGGYTTVGHRVTPSTIDLGLLSDIGYMIR